MAHLGTQENLSIEKYQKDLDKIKDKRTFDREVMRKKLEKKGFKFQKDAQSIEKKYNEKKKEGTLTDQDLLLSFITLDLTPMVHAAMVQVRSANEMVVRRTKDIKDVYGKLPTSFSMTNGMMALIEPGIEKFTKQLKEHYKKVYK